MRRLVIFVLLCCMIAPLAAQAQQSGGFSVTCDNGASFDNGIEIIVTQMRSGFTYTATAVGIDGFDPVLAVLDSTGSGLCNDDDANAAAYGADLPTTGSVSPSNLSAQVTFDQNSSSTFADVSLVVGGLGNTTGEFVLILEGMAVTSGDGRGDVFSVRLTPDMVASGVPLSVYMISFDTDLDSFIYRGDENLDVLADANGNDIYCDDAGNTELCYGSSEALGSSFVSTAAGELPGYERDAMLSLPIDQLELSDDPDLNFFNFVMTSYNQESQGHYALTFHMGTAPSGGSGGGKGSSASSTTPTDVPPSNSSLPSGVSVTCDNGATFDNGVEIIVNQMRSGFTYTATAVGMNGFDPVLAVLDSAGNGLCSDDEASARRYSADLPTTGNVSASNLSAQVTFDQNSASSFDDISLVVGGFGNTAGEFILILEGMGVTSGDGAGDPFSVRLTPGMVASGVPLSVYMITRGSGSVDPLVYRADENLDVLADADGNDIYCDDAGNTELCYGNSVDLSSSSVTIDTGTLPGWQYDAMLLLPIDQLELSDDPDLNFFNFVMTSYQQQTQGQYLLVFHIGMTESGTPNV
jgi:hypothetical protein